MPTENKRNAIAKGTRKEENMRGSSIEDDRFADEFDGSGRADSERLTVPPPGHAVQYASAGERKEEEGEEDGGVARRNLAIAEIGPNAKKMARKNRNMKTASPGIYTSYGKLENVEEAAPSAPDSSPAFAVRKSKEGRIKSAATQKAAQKERHMPDDFNVNPLLASQRAMSPNLPTVAATTDQNFENNIHSVTLEEHDGGDEEPSRGQMKAPVMDLELHDGGEEEPNISQPQEEPEVEPVMDLELHDGGEEEPKVEPNDGGENAPIATAMVDTSIPTGDNEVPIAQLVEAELVDLNADPIADPSPALPSGLPEESAPEAHGAQVATLLVDDVDKRPFWLRNRIPFVLGFLAVGIIGSLVILAVTGVFSGGSSSPQDSQMPSIAPSQPPTGAPTTAARFAVVQALLPISSREVVWDESTAQGQAVTWLMENDSVLEEEDYAQNPERVQQRFGLAVLYLSTNGSFWTSQFNFLDGSTSECDWRGVDQSGQPKGVNSCENGRVTRLDLSNNNLAGTIPPEIMGLSDLVTLDFSDNNIDGSIPDTISTISSMESIELSSNQLGGAIPTNIGNLQSVTFFSLHTNQLRSTVPFSMGDLTEVTDLLVHKNQLSGPMPSSFGNLTALRELNMESNFLSGSIPQECGNMVSLENLWLSNNSFNDGMDIFCSIGLNLFYADCLEQSFPATEAKVQCSCCTICCGGTTCLPVN